MVDLTLLFIANVVANFLFPEDFSLVDIVCEVHMTLSLVPSHFSSPKFHEGIPLVSLFRILTL